MTDFVLLGATGFIGSYILKALQDAGYFVATSSHRLSDRTNLLNFIEGANPGKGVICAAGERGRPNIDWCKDHPVETIDANIVGQLNVASICHELKLKCCLIGSGAMYSGDPFKEWSEDDKPPVDQNSHIYVKLRVQLEEMLKYYPQMLNLRVMYPIVSDLSDKRGLLGKMLSFPKVAKVQASCTFLEVLCPTIPILMEKNVTGNVNFVNPGRVDYHDAWGMMKDRFGDEFKAEKVNEAGRGSCILSTKKLEKAVGVDLPILDANDLLRQMLGVEEL